MQIGDHMKLSVKALKNVDSVNAFQYSNQAEAFQGQPNDLYFQLFDEHRGIRYIPDSGSILTVKFDNVNSENIIQKTASNPFPQDQSVFKVSLTSIEEIGSGGVSFILTENGIQKPFYVKQIVIFNSLDVGGC
jgi:hypothetical protein